MEDRPKQWRGVTEAGRVVSPADALHAEEALIDFVARGTFRTITILTESGCAEHVDPVVLDSVTECVALLLYEKSACDLSQAMQAMFTASPESEFDFKKSLAGSLRDNIRILKGQVANLNGYSNQAKKRYIDGIADKCARIYANNFPFYSSGVDYIIKDGAR